MAMLAKRGIAVLTAAGANATSVAELAIALMLASLRHIPHADAGIKAGEWPRRKGREIRDRQVGIFGCGAVGLEVARRAVALGARVLGHDPVTREVDLPKDRFRWATFEDVVAKSEIVSLHRPSLADGRPLFDAATLGRMQRCAILVNTSAGKRKVGTRPG